MMNKALQLITVLLTVLLLPLSTALAQSKGQTRIQYRDQQKEAAPPTDTATEALLDYREEMRKFVQSISLFSRRQRPNFLIIAENGLDLVVKRNIDDPEKTSPARTYMQSIDGVLHDKVVFGDKSFGKPPTDSQKKELFRLIDTAMSYGLKVMKTDYATKKKAIDALYRRYGKKGYIPFISSTLEMNVIPPSGTRPFKESSKSVLSMNDVNNYLYLGDSSGFGRQDEFTLKVHETNYDIVAVDIFHRRLPLSKQAVETLKYKKIGAKRLVLAIVDIGSAASYHYYWQPSWREGSPSWISAPFSNDPDKYHVKYWDPGWKKIISGDNKSYIYGVIDQGFDGVILKGLDAYRFFEGGGASAE